MWSEILVLLSALAGAAFLIFKSGRGFIEMKIFLCIAMGSVILLFLPLPGGIIPVVVLDEWSKIIGITAILIVLAFTIRQLKPLYARFPQAFSFTPVIILFFYPFITEADTLKNLLNQILQGGALLIVFLLYLSLSSKLKFHLSILAAFLLFSIVWVLHWFAGDPDLQPWIPHLLIASGVLTASHGFREVFSLLDEMRIT